MFLATAVSWLLQGSVYAAAIQEYTFQENMTYPVHTAQGVVTQIELDSREKVKDFGAGLSGGWDLVRRENVFYLMQLILILLFVPRLTNIFLSLKF